MKRVVFFFPLGSKGSRSDSKATALREIKRRQKKKAVLEKGKRMEVALPLAYFSVLFSNPLPSSSPFDALSPPTLPPPSQPPLSLFPSSTPFIRAAADVSLQQCARERAGEDAGVRGVSPNDTAPRTQVAQSLGRVDEM